MIKTIGKVIANGVAMTTKSFAIGAGITTGLVIGAIVLDYGNVKADFKRLKEANEMLREQLDKMNEQNDK